jgi:hypothetical protein
MLVVALAATAGEKEREKPRDRVMMVTLRC